MKRTVPVAILILSLMGLRCEAGTTLQGPPHQCLINVTSGSFLCLNKKIKEIPNNIPKNTTHVEIKLTHVTEFTERAFYELHNLKTIIISENGYLEQIRDFSFANLSRLSEITITKSKHLVIQRKAFWNLPQLKYLTISNTGLKKLPDFSRMNLAVPYFLLDLEDNIYLKEIHSNAFQGLDYGITADVRLAKNNIHTVHSFAFNGTKLRSLSLMGNRNLSHIHRYAFSGAEGPISLDISNTNVDFLPDTMLGSIQTLIATSVASLKRLPNLDLFTDLRDANLTYPSHCCAFANFRKNRSFVRPQSCDKPNVYLEEPVFYREKCKVQEEVICYPKPDAFNPCEDIMGHIYLRVLIWIICVLAVLGNAVVLLVLLTSRYKLTVPRFLMCHLAFADLCMGTYLMIIASVDIYTRSRYYNYGIDWQTGAGCRVAGFVTVFASELSIYTLTVITLERWHTITYAMQLERKLRLRHAAVLMLGGWLFALLVALLPAVGLSSSYGKVSICLPMDVEKMESQIYVVTVLLLNVAAFLGVCVFYLRIYRTVHNPQALPPLASASDTRLAKRMAVLIFTDFLCMAPISFFAISAALKWPLITVSHCKVLLVLFYPINSCANPFLYAFFTEAFKRDFFVLTSRFGCFKMQARIYRTESSSVQNSVWVPSPRSSDGTIYSLVHVGHQH